MVSNGTPNWAAFFRGCKLPHPTGKPDKQLPVVQRIAFVLDWAAERGEGVVVPYNVLYKVIMGLESTPRTINREVDLLRHRVAAVRPLLQSQYSRDLKTVPGVGVRATTSSLDVVKSTTVAAVKRVKSAHEALRRNAELVTAGELPTSGPDAHYHAWFTRTVNPALRALGNDDRIARLLPPAPPPVKPTDDENT